MTRARLIMTLSLSLALLGGAVTLGGCSGGHDDRVFYSDEGYYGGGYNTWYYDDGFDGGYYHRDHDMDRHENREFHSEGNEEHGQWHGGDGHGEFHGGDGHGGGGHH